MGRSADHRRWSGLPRFGRRVTAGLAVWSLLAAQSQAVPNLRLGDNKAAVAVCAAEREPLVELQREYNGVRRAQLTSTLTASAKAGLVMLLSANPMFAMASGVAKHAGMMGGQQQGAVNPNDPNNLMLSEALSLKIPGVDPPPSAAEGGSGKVGQLVRMVQPGQPVNDNSARTLLAISMVAAIGGSTDVYIKIKQQQYNNDAGRISQSTDGDAASQIPVATQSAAQLKALADCREKQVADYKDKLAGASDKEKKQLLRDQTGLKSALSADADLGSDLMTQQQTVARVLTQGRAMADGKSEADVLSTQASAYGQPSTQIWNLPPLETAAGSAPMPATSPKVTLVTIRATAIRATPDPKGAIVMHLAAGHTLTPSHHASADVAWWEIDVAGTLAYVYGADLAPPGSVQVAAATAAPRGKGRGRAGGAPAQAPGPPPAGAIRSLNSQVLAVKAGGADRLRALADSIQLAGA
jgi:hypothetical protein